jgi:hypothetical protein
MELYLIELSNRKEVYCIARNEDEARDKVSDWLKQRFIGGSPMYINSAKLLAESEPKGFVPKIVL